MQSSTIRVLTIVAKRSLQAELCAHLRACGFHDFTIVESLNGDAQQLGLGANAEQHVCLEALLPDDLGQLVLDRVQQHLPDPSSVVCFLADAPALSSLHCTTHSIGRNMGHSGAPARQEVWGDYLITL